MGQKNKNDEIDKKTNIWDLINNETYKEQSEKHRDIEYGASNRFTLFLMKKSVDQ